MTDKILDKVIQIALILQVAFILSMNLFRAYTVIDFDSSSAYMHEMEMGSQGKIFPSEYSYQSTMDLDSASLISAFLFHFTGDIFLSRGIANNLVILLYIWLTGLVLTGIGVSQRWKRFGILLFLIPYSMTILGYWRMLFTGGGFFAFRALVPLLVISLIMDIDRGAEFEKYAIRTVLLLFILFLTGLSSGAYVVLCAICPLLLWEMINAFLKGDLRQILSKRTILVFASVIASITGIAVQKAVGFSSLADRITILRSDKWADAVLAAFAGVFELFGGLTVHDHVALFSAEALAAAAGFAVTCILITAIVYTLVISIKKKEISNMKGYILSLLLTSALMFGFLDLKYGVTVFESRYHLIPMLPSFFLVAEMMDELSKSRRLKEMQRCCLQVLTTGIFIASMLAGDAQWVYAGKVLGSKQLSELNRIVEEEGINTAFVVGEDNRDLGRKLRVYGRNTHYIVVDDGAKSASRTTWGGTTRYLDNSMQAGKTAIIASPESFRTLPSYLVTGMKHVRDYDGLQIYVAKESRFDCVGGVIAEKDRVVDFPYSPDYTYENAFLDDQGRLIMKDGGGTLKSSYASAAGIWDYTIYYDMPKEAGDAFVEITVGEKKPIRAILDPTAETAQISGVSMEEGNTVSFSVDASQGTRIQKIEIAACIEDGVCRKGVEP